MLQTTDSSARILRFKQVMTTMFPTKSLVILIAIGVLDLISTAVLHSKGLIVEMNPLMRVFIERSEWLFAFVKGLTIGAAWVTMAWYAQQNKAFVSKVCGYGSFAYLGLWVVWFMAAR